MEIDIAKLKYSVKAQLETGELLDLTGLCTELSWGDDKGSVAAKASITLANTKIEKGYISDLIKLCIPLFIEVNNSLVFQGIVWEWSYTSALEKELSITAYDQLIYMTQSKDYNYFTSGKSTQFIIEDMCKKWDIPVEYQWENWTHGKTPLKISTLSDHITTILEEAQTKLDSKYVVLMKNNTLVVCPQGSNTDIFQFHSKNSISTSNNLSLQSLVTKVVIMGKEEEEKRPPVLETKEGKLEYGTLQEIVTKDTNKTLADAQKEAENILKEKGKPEETIDISAPDVPQIRKGDKVKVVAGNLNGYFFVEGITHNGTDKTMDMELIRQ